MAGTDPDCRADPKSKKETKHRHRRHHGGHHRRPTDVRPLPAEEAPKKPRKYLEFPMIVKLPVKTEMMVTTTGRARSTGYVQGGGSTASVTLNTISKNERSDQTVLKVRTKGITDTSADAFYSIVEAAFLEAYFEQNSAEELKHETLDSMDKQYKTQFRTFPLLGCRVLLCLAGMITCVEDPSKFLKAKNEFEAYCHKVIRDEEEGVLYLSVPEKVAILLPSFYNVTCSTACFNLHNIADTTMYDFREELLLIRFIQLYKLKDRRADVYLRELPNARKIVEGLRASQEAQDGMY